MRFSLLSSFVLAGASTVLADPSISSFPNSLTLSASFDPIIAAYWTGLPHHRRTPFAVSPDGKSAFLAYLDSTKKNVVVQQVDTTAFTAVGTAVTIPGYEAAGLVAHDDGFALMATTDASGTTDLPTNNMPIVALIRYKNGAEAWRTPLNGPGVHKSEGLTATPDANGDLVYSATAGLYSAYFVVTAYTGNAAGHFGDSIQYVNDAGALQTIASSSTFGCSHNTGIGIEAADAPPFATICAEDQGSIWLNTDTQYMSGVKIANENTTNGVSGEPMGGMSGSYSNLALFPSTTNYVFAWQSRGAVDLTTNDWLGAPYTQCSPRWLNHNVAISTMASKNKLTGAEASSTVGAADGDSQVNWITKSETDDHQNVHVAAISSSLALVTWETLTNPTCQPVPLSCSGTYAGTSFQVIDKTGAKVGAAVTDTKVFVSGDIANVGTDKVCWPYVDMTWDLSKPKDSGTPVTKMSFACASTGGGIAVVSSSSAAVASSSAAPVVSASKEAVVAPSSTAAGNTPVETPNPSLVPVEPTAEPTVSVPAVSEAPVATSAADGAVNTPVTASSSSGSVDFITATFPSEGLTTAFPTNVFPTGFPTDLFPTDGVTALPTDLPTGLPSGFPTTFASGFPTAFPTGKFPAGSWSKYKGKHGHHHTTFSTKTRAAPTVAPSAAADDDAACEA